MDTEQPLFVAHVVEPKTGEISRKGCKGVSALSAFQAEITAIDLTVDFVGRLKGKLLHNRLHGWSDFNEQQQCEFREWFQAEWLHRQQVQLESMRNHMSLATEAVSDLHFAAARLDMTCI